MSKPINVGNQFKIKESGKILLVTSRSKGVNGMFNIRYYDGSKSDLQLDEVHINKNITSGAWILTKI